MPGVSFPSVSRPLPPPPFSRRTLIPSRFPFPSSPDLNEISPPAFRGTFPGVAYQLGNMVSSAASQIEATAGEHLKVNLNGKEVPDYAKIQGILIGVVSVFTIVMVLLGGTSPSTFLS